jgi:hypothetical protein
VILAAWKILIYSSSSGSRAVISFFFFCINDRRIYQFLTWTLSHGVIFSCVHIWNKLRRKLCTLERRAYLQMTDSIEEMKTACATRIQVMPLYSGWIWEVQLLHIQGAILSRWNSTTGLSMVVVLGYTTTCLPLPPTHWIQILDEVNLFNLPNPASRTMALEST